MNYKSWFITFIFIALFNLSGYSQINIQWALSPENHDGIVEGNCIKVDTEGNTYITGSFSGTADFDPSVNTANMTSIGIKDIFIAKYDASGNYIYAKNMGGINSDDEGNSICIDNLGNVCITGNLKGTADFDPSADTANLTSLGAGDIFIAKYDASGNYIYAKRMGGADIDVVNSIAVDIADNIYITGYFRGTTDFDPSANVVNLTSTGVDDIFIAKYDASGNYIYAKNMGGTYSDYGNSLAVDASGNCYITGYFRGIADFDPSANVANITSAGSSDIFIAKYDASGNYVYAKSLGGTNYDVGNSIDIDTLGNVYIIGNFFGTADFDPSASVAYLTSVSYDDIFIAKYDASGNYVYAKSIGSTFYDSGNSIVVDTSSNVYITGYFYDVADFDPSANVVNLTSEGDYDIFIAKYDTSGNYIFAKSLGGFNTETGNSIAVDALSNVYITGTFTGTVDFDPSANSAYLTTDSYNSNSFIGKYN